MDEAPEEACALVADRPAFADRPVRRARSFTESRHKLEALAQAVAATPEGNRNNILFWAACRAVEEGAPDVAIVDALSLAAAAAGETDERAIARTLDSALRRTS